LSTPIIEKSQLFPVYHILKHFWMFLNFCTFYPKLTK